MGTGVQPIGDLEYDIDIGLRFCFRDADLNEAACAAAFGA